MQRQRGLNWGCECHHGGGEHRREAGDLLEVADGGVAPHVVLLLDVFKFRRVDVHPGQRLGAKREQTCAPYVWQTPHLVHVPPVQLSRQK